MAIAVPIHPHFGILEVRLSFLSALMRVGGEGADPPISDTNSWKAYRDSDLLDRFHVPYIGRIAQRWVEEE